MKIGNWENSEKSEKTEALIALIQSENPKNLTKKEKWKNWWHYYKWYVVCGILLFAIAVDLIGNALGLWQKSPDFQIAYVGNTEFPPDTAAALENIFSSMQELDLNRDGEVIVRINQYSNGLQGTDMNNVYYEYSSEIALIGDISDCESYFFLMDDPDSFQREYQLLADPDGNCPADTDYSADNKAVLWSDCPVLSEIASSAEAAASGSQAFLSKLYIGRRCFYTDTLSENAEECNDLWNLLTTTRTNTLS